MTCIAILEAPRTAELDSLLSISNPLPIEEISDVTTALVPAAWFKAEPTGALVELVDSLELGECLSLDENQLSLIIYGGLADVVDTTGKASDSVWHFIGNMETYIEEEVGFHGFVGFLKTSCVFIQRLK